MQDSPSLIEQIKQQADLVAFARDALGLDLTKKGREWVGLCPIHNERSPSFFINPQKQVFICRGCGAGGDIINLAAASQQLPIGEAVRWLARHYQIDIPERTASSRPKQATSSDPLEDTQAARTILRATAAYFHSQLARSDEASAYITARGIGDRQVQAYSLGYAPDGYNLAEVIPEYMDGPLESRWPIRDFLKALGLVRASGAPFFERRLMFPVADAAGTVCGFSGRRLDDASAEPKYVNSPDSRIFQKKRLLFGLSAPMDSAREHRDYWRHLIGQNEISIVEGFTDVLALARCGLYGAATMGTAMTDEHIQLLQRRGIPRVVCCFDGDRAGRDAAWRVTDKLFDHIRDAEYWGVRHLPDGVDVDDFLSANSPDAFKALPQLSCSQYWLSQSLQPIKNNDALEHRVRLWRDFLQVRERMSHAPILAHLMEGELQRQLGSAPLPMRATLNAHGLPAWHGQPVHPVVADMLRLVICNPGQLQALRPHPDTSWVARRLTEPMEPAFSGLKLVLFAQSRLDMTEMSALQGGWQLLMALVAAGLPADWLSAWAQVAPPEDPSTLTEHRQADLIEQWEDLVHLAQRQHEQYPIWLLTQNED